VVVTTGIVVRDHCRVVYCCHVIFVAFVLFFLPLLYASVWDLDMVANDQCLIKQYRYVLVRIATLVQRL
jgi:hypothetical protein